jgi:hypothetical protein
MSGETIGGGTSDDMEELDAACNNPTRSCHIIKTRAPEFLAQHTLPKP